MVAWNEPTDNRRSFERWRIGKPNALPVGEGRRRVSREGLTGYGEIVGSPLIASTLTVVVFPPAAKVIVAALV